MVKQSPSRMQILFIARAFWPSSGAAATVNTEIAKILADKGHEINLLGPNYASMEKTDSQSHYLLPVGIRTYRFGPRLSRLPAFTISFIILVLRAIPLACKAHVILCEYHHSHLGSLCAAITSIITRKPTVVRVHDLLFPPTKSRIQLLVNFVLRWSTLWSFRRAKCVLVPGDELVQLCQQTYGLKEGRVDVSYNGVDARTFNPHNRRNDIRRKIGSHHIVIFSGWISLGRGIDVLFQAVNPIRRRVRDLKVIITGPSFLPTSIIQLKHLAESLGIGDCVEFTHEVPYAVLRQYLASADVGVGELVKREANYGSTPLKLIEYMASGCVVVTARGAVCSQLVRDGFNGLLTTSGDAADVARKMLSVFNNPRLARKLRSTARRTVKKTFTWNMIVTKLERTLQAVAIS